MKTLHYPISIAILIVASFYLINSHNAYAACITFNGTKSCEFGLPVLDSIKSDKLTYVNSDKPVFTIYGIPYSQVNLEITDSSGNIVFANSIELPSNGIANYTLDISSFNFGKYVVIASTSTSKVSTTFTIDRMHLTSVPNIVIESPLEQFKSGIKAQDLKCNDNLQLIFKSSNGSPACVKPSSIPRLLGQGWIDTRDNNGKYHRGETSNSSGIADLQNESQIIIPDGLTLQNSQLNLQPQVIKVILGINNTVKWIKTGDLPSRIQSVYPFSPSWFDGMVYPKKPFYFTFNQTGEYIYHVLGGVGEKQGKITVTTPEFEQSNLLRPKLLTGGPENIVHMLLTAQDDQLQGLANFTFEQIFPTKKGKIAIADAMSDYLPISYTLNKSIIPLTESNTVNFTKEFLNKVGFVLDGTERFDVRNFGYVIYVYIYQTNNYKIDTQNVSFVFSNDTTIVSFGQWSNNISKQKLTLSSNDAKIMAKQFIESEAKTNSYLKKYHASITPIKVNLEVIDDKLMWLVFAKVTETMDGKQITLPGSMEVMIDMHSGKVFSWKLLAVSYT